MKRIPPVSALSSVYKTQSSPDMIVEGNGRRDAPQAGACWKDPHSARVSRLTETSQQQCWAGQPATATLALVSHPQLISSCRITYVSQFCHCTKRLQQRGRISGWIGYLRSCIHYILRCTTPSHRGIMRKRKAAPRQILFQFPSTSEPCDTQRKR